MSPPRTSSAATVTDPVLAAGVVLWCQGQDEPHFLLLRNARHQSWGLSKGHLEPGEDLLQGAIRETVEETSYQLSPTDLFPDFADTSLYQPKADVWKRVIYFLCAQPVDPDQLQISAEHTEARWLPLAQALELIPFPALHRTLVRAANRL
ncbi:MAG: NUDIX domain-containing protein [Planctomycetes bacterium]|nr:NUDIX domain-containing protein [Planctomycetota bacterium]